MFQTKILSNDKLAFSKDSYFSLVVVMALCSDLLCDLLRSLVIIPFDSLVFF